MNRTGSVTSTTVGVKIRSRLLFEVSTGTTSVFLDWGAARTLLDDLNRQLETSEIVRINAKCVTSYSMISNFPASREEVKSLIRELSWYVEES